MLPGDPPTVTGFTVHDHLAAIGLRRLRSADVEVGPILHRMIDAQSDGRMGRQAVDGGRVDQAPSRDSLEVVSCPLSGRAVKLIENC
jgi:hypothetical protein